MEKDELGSEDLMAFPLVLLCSKAKAATRLG